MKEETLAGDQDKCETIPVNNLYSSQDRVEKFTVLKYCPYVKKLSEYFAYMRLEPIETEKLVDKLPNRFKRIKMKVFKKSKADFTLFCLNKDCKHCNRIQVVSVVIADPFPLRSGSHER